MTPTDDQIAERLPVWEALSEFYLDTELEGGDYDRIAARLSASRYTEAQLEDILAYEVNPACKWNLYSMAGEWDGFHPDWLKEQMTPLYDRRPGWSRYFHSNRLYQRHWVRVRALIREYRTNRAASLP